MKQMRENAHHTSVSLPTEHTSVLRGHVDRISDPRMPTVCNRRATQLRPASSLCAVGDVQPFVLIAA